MDKPQFHDEFTLSTTTIELGKKAMNLGLIPSFVVRYYPDSQEFYIPKENESDPLTTEEAYMRLKKLVEQAEQ